MYGTVSRSIGIEDTKYYKDSPKFKPCQFFPENAVFNPPNYNSQQKPPDNLTNQYSQAEKITLVMDNYETHKPGSFYDTFPADKAKKLRDRFEFVYTPKHGSWLNMAEIELTAITE